MYNVKGFVIGVIFKCPPVRLLDAGEEVGDDRLGSVRCVTFAHGTIHRTQYTTLPGQQQINIFSIVLLNR